VVLRQLTRGADACSSSRARETNPDPSECRLLNCSNVALTAADADALALEAVHIDNELASPARCTSAGAGNVTHERPS
jgi:hypothetical protein